MRRASTLRVTVIALARSTHPGPSLAVTAITVLMAVGVSLGPARVVLLGAVMLLGQASVGLSNDWLDAARDRAVGRLDKPVALGLVSISTARVAAWICAGVAIGATVPLGTAATLAHIVFIASAWSYNLVLKKTVFSVLPYLVSFGLLPAIVTLSRETPRPAAAWAIGVGALLGAAAHFANVLPDLEDDRATGVRGLPQRLGRARVSILTYLILVAAGLLEFANTGGTRSVVSTGALVVTLAIAIVGCAILRRPTRWHFRMIMGAAVVDVAALVVAGTRLLG